jgi:hypothetical protein
VGIDDIISKCIFKKWNRCGEDSLGSGWALVNTVMSMQVPYKWDTSQLVMELTSQAGLLHRAA